MISQEMETLNLNKGLRMEYIFDVICYMQKEKEKGGNKLLV